MYEADKVETVLLSELKTDIEKLLRCTFR